jgi:hypothetical protein
MERKGLEPYRESLEKPMVSLGGAAESAPSWRDTSPALSDLAAEVEDCEGLSPADKARILATIDRAKKRPGASDDGARQ